MRRAQRSEGTGGGVGGGLGGSVSGAGLSTLSCFWLSFQKAHSLSSLLRAASAAAMSWPTTWSLAHAETLATTDPLCVCRTWNRLVVARLSQPRLGRPPSRASALDCRTRGTVSRLSPTCARARPASRWPGARFTTSENRRGAACGPPHKRTPWRLFAARLPTRACSAAHPHPTSAISLPPTAL